MCNIHRRQTIAIVLDRRYRTGSRIVYVVCVAEATNRATCVLIRYSILLSRIFNNRAHTRCMYIYLYNSIVGDVRYSSKYIP